MCLSPAFFPVSYLALQIQFGLGCWASGRFISAPFHVDAVYPFYREHAKFLVDLKQAMGPAKFHKMMHGMFKTIE